MSRQYEREKRPTASFDLLPDMPYKDLAGTRAKDDVTKRPGLIVSDALVGIKKGEPPPEAMYELPTTLTLLPVLPGEAVKAQDAVTPALALLMSSRICWTVPGPFSQSTCMMRSSASVGSGGAPPP